MVTQELSAAPIGLTVVPVIFLNMYFAYSGYLTWLNSQQSACR